MKKVFLSTSFSGKVDAQSGQVLPDFRAQIEQLLAGLRKDNACEIFCAVETEGWMVANNIPAEVGVRKDVDAIDRADVLVALVEAQPSVGVQFEIGYAVAKGKQVILAHLASEKPAYFNQGAVGAGLLDEVAYDDTDKLVAQLLVAINAPASEV